jgi:hypothetical protein
MVENPEQKRLVAYSLLAALGEESGQDGFDHIFIPLVKKGLIQINNKGLKRGSSIIEIREELQFSFGLEFPLPYLKKLITSISHQFKREFGGEIIVHADNSFLYEESLSEKLKLNNEVIKDFERKVIEEEHRIVLIENLFKKFLDLNGLKDKHDVTLLSFIDLNKIALSHYFAKEQNEALEIKDLNFKEKELSIVARFFIEIKKDHQTFDILKKLYLGSVYSSYLTIEPEQSTLKLELVLDTSFILGLLNLISIESADTCKKIFDISRKLGFQLTVLKITIEEIQNVLDVMVDIFNDFNLERQLRPESILAACDRNKIDRNELARISARIEEKLVKEFGINVVQDDAWLRKLAKSKYKDLFDFLRTNKPTDFNALHDTTCEAYVKETRGRPVYSFLTSVAWFVKGSSLNVYKPIKRSGLPAFISSPVLVNVLWLSNPSARVGLSKDDVAQMGITKLISSTLDGSLPPTSVLKTFNKNITRLASKQIDVSDCVIVAMKMAEQDIINDLNKSIESNLSHPEIIVAKVNKYKAEIEKRDEVWKEEIRTFIAETQRQFSREKADFLAERQLTSEENTRLLKEQQQLKQQLISFKVNHEFKRWQSIAYYSLFLFVVSTAIIALSIFFQEADWNAISKFYSWVNSTDNPRKEFLIVGCIDLFFGVFDSFCIRIIWERWLSKKAKEKKLQLLNEKYTLEIAENLHALPDLNSGTI